MRDHKEAWEFEPADLQRTRVPLSMWLWACGLLLAAIAFARWIM